MSISGFLVWAKVNNILYFLYFALIFSSIELILNIFLIALLANDYQNSWLNFLFTTFNLTCCNNKLIFFIEIVNIYRLLIMFIILMLSRGFIKNRIVERINMNKTNESNIELVTVQNLVSSLGLQVIAVKNI